MRSACPDCNGTGQVTLFTSVASCQSCAARPVPDCIRLLGRTHRTGQRPLLREGDKIVSHVHVDPDRLPMKVPPPILGQNVYAKKRKAATSITHRQVQQAIVWNRVTEHLSEVEKQEFLAAVQDQVEIQKDTQSIYACSVTEKPQQDDD